MRIAVKLMGLLKSQTPPGGELELPDGASIADALATLKIDAPRNFMLSVNGQLERDRTRALLDRDQLTVLPPVGGG